ncbi:carbonic anhydrase [Cercophora newfieldiana]|uniref:Carbonic anhydrase n=1 Tax=Cercophora newfieldiana TaxID=92897 RepID=A0AA40CXF7_9PEZI|nr:carbonic anhydrase [Cercophora newfieldiana]
MSTTIADLLERNKATSPSHVPLPSLGDFGPNGSTPVPKTMIITCCDPRCIPEKFFNLKDSEVIVARNAGGNVRHALRDIHIIDTLFSLDELAIIHHTDCGTLHFSEETIRSSVKSWSDEAYWSEIDGTVYGANADLEESVREDVAWVHAHPTIREGLKKGTQGYVFDIKTGKVEKVNPK